MTIRFFTILIILFTGLLVSAQNAQQVYCGQKSITENLFNKYPALKIRYRQTEALLARYNKEKYTALQKGLQTQSVVTLPVVVHIIHNNGVENISDARVLQGIQHLNDAFAKNSYYATGAGTNTGIQFCMAERTPGGNATNGITRDVSPHTIMGGSEYYADDSIIKNIDRWNTSCYINIWLVNSIPGDVVGYAYLPAAAGTAVDGIVMEAAYFGSSYANDIVITHEMGHYFGLYHTFEGGCTNNDCVTDGDKVCDTPPDQSTASVTCNVQMNSCTTDMLSGFGSDQNDLKEDFMDYGNFDCMNTFTPGQAERMNWFIQHVRSSLLNCKSCLPPCPTPVKTFFTSTAKRVTVGSTVTFSNQSVNANSYQWYIDGVLKASSKDYSFLFTSPGMHIVKLLAKSNNALCDDGQYNDTIQVSCPVKAAFNSPAGFVTMGQSINFTNSSVNAQTFVWKVNGISKGTTYNFSYLFQQPGIYAVTLIAADALCTDSITGMLSVYDSTGAIPAGLCEQTTFQKKFTKNSKIIYDLRPVKDSGYIMAGGYFTPEDVYGGAYAAKLDRGGSLIWARHIMPFSWAQLQKIKETSDGSYIGTGVFYEVVNNQLITRALLLKLSASGDLLWAKKFGITGSPGEKGLDVTELKDGYAFCGSSSDNSWNLTNWMVCKTDKNGNLTWSKTLDDNFYERAYSLISQGDTLIVTGIRTIPAGPRSEIVVTQLAAADGSIIRAKAFDVANRSVETTSIFKVPGGYMVGAHSIGDGFFYADMNIEVLRLDEDLNVLKAGKIEADIFASVHGGFSPTPDGGFVALQEGPNASVTKDQTAIMIFKVSSQWQLEWSKQFPLPTTEGQLDFCINGLFPTYDKGYIIGETYVNTLNGGTGEYLRIIKTDDKGNTPGCMTDTFKANFVTPDVTASEFNWGTVKDIHFNNPEDPSIHDPVVADAGETALQRCETSKCDYLKIMGKDSICDTSDTIVYTCRHNAECTSSVQWQVDTTAVTIVFNADSLIKFVFRKTGLIKLYARITTSCLVLQDSMGIYVSDALKAIDLGPDIQLCRQSTVKLGAGVDFRSYRWNDGSVDSILTAYRLGTYYVTATDYCGNLYSDTINITQAPDISFDLGPDINRCDNDSVTITGPASFEKYIWSPDYKISSTTEGIIKAWPDVDTVYVLTAQKNAACTAIDSIRIKVLRAAPLSIGNDTAFCTGGQVILKAPAGFLRYTWQDGSAGETFNATSKGAYWLHALNENGCLSSDTILVRDEYPLPVVNLGNDGMICSNNTIFLKAGQGFTSYVWNDGSKLESMEVKYPGKYWVSVTDNNSCSVTDSITITGFYPAPQGFLNHSTEICPDAVIQLKAVGIWQSYGWYDNSTQPFVVVKAPGKYWLEVTDLFGCKARDTINVILKQDCPKTIYFPTAFSPNNDGRNDYYKPAAGAPLEKFGLEIYNRWGQKVFETNSISESWNGKSNGIELNAGTYTWYCKYKFYGQPERLAKGTLVLIR